MKIIKKDCEIIKNIRNLQSELLRVFGSKYFNTDQKDALLDCIKQELGEEIFERISNAKKESCEISEVDFSEYICSHDTSMFLGEKLQVNCR
jgi:hypothetical protein